MTAGVWILGIALLITLAALGGCIAYNLQQWKKLDHMLEEFQKAGFDPADRKSVV